MTFTCGRISRLKIRIARWGRWALLVALFSSLCLAPVVNVVADSRYEGEGQVLCVDVEKHMLFVAHGPIPGFMPRPMRHGFEVHKVELLKGLEKGDRVRFVLEVQDEIFGISSVEKVKESP